MDESRLEVGPGDIVESKDKRLNDRLWTVVKVDSLIATLENQVTKQRVSYGLAVMKDMFKLHKVANND